jgi:hypothetical protein
VTRRECAHGRDCGYDLCPCDDPSGLVLECDEFEDTGRRRRMSRSPEVLRPLIAEKKAAFAKLKNGAGFKFGQGKIAQKEVQRRRAEIRRLEDELGWRE